MEPLVYGRPLGRFSLREQLAATGTAEIWVAEPTVGPTSDATPPSATAPPAPTAAPPSQVVLKILRRPTTAEAADDSAHEARRQRFIREGRVAVALRHPNIVEVFEVHDTDGWLFLSQERVVGRQLAQILSDLAGLDRRLPLEVALFIARDVARALAYAHGSRGDGGEPRGLVHRALCPETIVIADSGRIKVSDFSAEDRAQEATASRTPALYLAPEQTMGLAATPQTDIFLLGLVLWELLTTRPAFSVGGEATIDRVARAEVPPLAEVSPDVPADVADLVGRMLQARAPDRPASMQSVERDLTRALVERDDALSERSVGRWIRDLSRTDGPTPTPPGVDGDRTEPTALPGPRAREGTETPIETGDPTIDHVWRPPEAVTPPNAKTPPTKAGPGADDTSTDGVRLPTHSEIMQAVENQPTMPVPAPPSKPVEVRLRPPGKAADAAASEEAAEPDPSADPSAQRTPDQTPDQAPDAAPRSSSGPRPGSKPDFTVQLRDEPEPHLSDSMSASDPSWSADLGRALAPAAGGSRPSGGSRLLPLITLVLAVLVLVLGGLLWVRS